MDAKQNLYYALGQVAYALASADGKIQKEEKQKIHSIVLDAVKEHQLDFDYSEIIFSLLEKDHIPMDTAYAWSIEQFWLNSQYLSEKMKLDFISVLENIAAAFPPTTLDEKKLIARFKKDISAIKGDPVFTGEH